MKAEEQEVRDLLISNDESEGEGEVSDGLEYVSDSEGDLLLSPVPGLRSPL